MNKLFSITVILLALLATGTSNAMGNYNPANEACGDALRALQLTRSAILDNLQESMRADLDAMDADKFGGFGIDDTRSYTQQQQSTLSRAGSARG